MPSPFLCPGVRQPPVQGAEKADLADDTPVVGVVAGGKARAYTLEALSQVRHHVVNDLLGEVPVTVTYCDLARCLRVFTSDTAGIPLEIDQAGRFTDGLLLIHDGKIYAQATADTPRSNRPPDMPLPTLPAEQTTWKSWREKHPRTTVYTGPDAEESPADEP